MVRAVVRGLSIAALSIGVAWATSVDAATYDWTGLHGGAIVGWGFANAHGTSHKLDPNGFGSNRTSSGSRAWNGVIGGGEAGLDWMVSPNVVLGIEGDFSGADLTDKFEGISTDGISFKTNSFDWVGTVRGRVGYAWDNWLIYGTGGGAWTHGRLTNVQGPCNPDPTCAGGNVPLGTTDSTSLTQTGWTAGAGIAVAIASNWTIKLQYLHMDFGSFTNANPSFNRVDDVDSFTANIVETGVDYKF